MPFEKEQDIVDELSKFLLDTMTVARPSKIPERFASVDSLQTLYDHLIALREILYAASNGDMSTRIAFKGFIGGALKTLQANLKHMTWQTKMVASGDFTQRVEFIGEFSQAFNAMVMQLDQTLKEVARKDAELSGANEDLLKEIKIRKQTEADLRESEEAFRRMAITDSLTGLYNRGHFNQLAENEINRVLRYSRPLSVIMFDIDFFKRVNDTYGHAVGDMVLMMVANTTKAQLRAADIFARYGSEEFIVFLPETYAAGAAAIAEKLRRSIETADVQGENYLIAITASFGVNDYLEKTDSKPHDRILSEFISKADEALYKSKNAGRNRVTVYAAGG